MSQKLTPPIKERRVKERRSQERRSSQLQEAQEESMRIRAVLNSMAEGLIATNETGHITAINSYALKALGFTEEELLDQWFSGVIVAVDQHRQILDAFDRPIVRALTSGQAISEHGHYLRKDGRMMPVFITVSPIVKDGKPSGAIELFRDTTSERQLDIAKDEFVSLASHQLRTPASGVEAVLSMLLAGDLGSLTPLQHKYVAKAAQSNSRQLQIIEDILNIAQIDAGKMELDKDDVDIVKLLRQVATEQAPIFKQKQQKVKLKLPTSLTMCGDTQKMRMVFDNVISNASKYTPAEGSIIISGHQELDHIVVAVTDTGVGMGQQDLSRLFNKFARFDNPLSTLAGGSGLGLYLVKNIVDLHRGDIIVESSPGEGSTFRIILPIK